MPNLSHSELADLRDQINTFHQKGIEAAKWGIVYFINAGEGLRAVREALPSRTFRPWLQENFEGGRTTAYKYIKLAEEKGKIHALSVHRGEQIESMRKAFAVLGAYYEEESTDAITDIQPPITDIQPPITDIQTPESPAGDGASMPSPEPAPLANGAGGSPAPTEAEQVILDRLLKPDERTNFESGLDHEYEEYQCYLCKNWFFADQVKTLQSNRYCYSCRLGLPDNGGDDDEQAENTADTSGYEATLFDEPVPEGAMAPALPGANGQATTTPTAMTVQDPYDEMLTLSDLIFPLLSKMEDVRTYGIHGPLRRFIDLFREIHQL